MLPNTGKAAYSIRRIRLSAWSSETEVIEPAVCLIGRRARPVANCAQQVSMTAGKRCTSNAMQSGIRRFPRLVRFEQSRAGGNSVVRRGMGDRNVQADLAVTHKRSPRIHH